MAVGCATTATTSITVAIGTNPASWTIAGTTTVAAVSGVATFSTLSLNRAATGLTGATSSAFNVVAGGLTFAALSAGGYTTCGVTPSGAAYCWGYNFSGQLGNGTTTQSLTPVAVSGGLTFGP